MKDEWSEVRETGTLHLAERVQLTDPVLLESEHLSRYHWAMNTKVDLSHESHWTKYLRTKTEKKGLRFVLAAAGLIDLHKVYGRWRKVL
jgi:hypothetical protein